MFRPVRTHQCRTDQPAVNQDRTLAALYANVVCTPLPHFFSEEQINHTLLNAGISHILDPQGLRETGLASSDAIPEKTAKVTFTSGTTGTPKGVCLPARAMENVSTSILTVLENRLTNGTHCCVLPLSVLLENVAGVYTALMAGCTVHIPSLYSYGQNYEHLHEILGKTHATSIILVPEILRILMQQTASRGGLAHLKFIAVGGAKIDADLVRMARDMHLPVYEGYGLSECASVVALNTPKHDKVGTVGTLLPHVKARIVDGEVEIKDPGFLGYIGEEAPSMLSTGDVGFIDSDGYLSITGRKKNVLITSYGRNVSPEWVEAVLLGASDIKQAFVYGDAQPHLSALIVTDISVTELQMRIDEINAKLPDYARIKDFKIVPAFTPQNGTLTPNGRLRREKILTLYHKEKSNELLQSTC